MNRFKEISTPAWPRQLRNDGAEVDKPGSELQEMGRNTPGICETEATRQPTLACVKNTCS